MVVAHASVLTDGLNEHATVIFPAESHAEKDGTVTHPDGRVQRLRIAIAHPGEVRAGWSVLSELARRCGVPELGVQTAKQAFEQMVSAVPQYAGLSLDEIAGHGVRWPEHQAARTLWTEDDAAGSTDSDHDPAGAPDGDGASGTPRLRPTEEQLALGTYRSIWAAPEVEISPALQYQIARQLVELSPQDAARYEIRDGEEIVIRANGTLLNGTAHVRTGIPEGSAFLAEGIAANSANRLTEQLVAVQSARAYREELLALEEQAAAREEQAAAAGAAAPEARA